MWVVARDGYPQHSTVFQIPINLYLDPKWNAGGNGNRAA
jgi:hypothetical protein